MIVTSSHETWHVITLLQYLIDDCMMNLRTHQCHVLSVLSDDAPGLFAQEYHHVYWGAMFLLSHQAETTQRVSGYGNVQFILLLKALSMIVDPKTRFFRFKQSVKGIKVRFKWPGTSSKHGITVGIMQYSDQLFRQPLWEYFWKIARVKELHLLHVLRTITSNAFCKISNKLCSGITKLTVITDNNVCNKYIFSKMLQN